MLARLNTTKLYLQTFSRFKRYFFVIFCLWKDEIASCVINIPENENEKSNSIVVSFQSQVQPRKLHAFLFRDNDNNRYLNHFLWPTKNSIEQGL